VRIVRFVHGGVPRTGIVDEHDVVRETVADAAGTSGAERALADLTLLPAVERSSMIVCVGLNYVDHATEAAADLPTSPLLFGKSSNTLAAHGEPIGIPVSVTQAVDYEAELGVVMGRRCRDVSEADALDFVRGYTCVNDVSARDLQFAHGQWFRGKSVDTFCPAGPFLVTADEIPDPQALAIQCRVNGTLLQDSSTAHMVFSVRELISYISRTITLEPGDLIATGTPEGVGFARDPKVLLQPGDTVSVFVECVGTLTNPVVGR
jgi:2-keto-4-pentenoate hydratase/2-oxohepta-3-ene-1,7-dioic acid hydratase in catechol pathway